MYFLVFCGSSFIGLGSQSLLAFVYFFPLVYVYIYPNITGQWWAAETTSN